MKYSAIREIFYGNVGHQEQVKPTQKYLELIEKAIVCDENIRKKLQTLPEVLKLYDAANECVEALNVESCDTHYVEGFKLGVLLGLEVGESIAKK